MKLIGHFFGPDGADYTTSISDVQRASPSQDWVREFRVASSPYAADNGRNLGAVVNTVTKSGGNDVHGSVYEFFRNNQLASNNLLLESSAAQLQGFDVEHATKPSLLHDFCRL